VSLVLVDHVLGDLLVPLVSTYPIETHVYNKMMEDYVVSIFDFVDKFLANDGAVCFYTLTIFMFSRK
jgi:hypothetical protein